MLWLAAVAFSGSASWTYAQRPDLFIYGPSAQPEIIIRNLSSSDCEVQEGCATPGTRKLLSFNTEFRNAGPADLVIGNPADSPLFFEWGACHGHWHFPGFAEYRLRSVSSGQVFLGRKMSFCIEDARCWSNCASTRKRYGCNNMGLQVGWADVYDKSVPCQWLDITSVPGGDYVLEMVADPNDVIDESNEGNNITQVPVTIPSDCSAPANDAFASAQAIPAAPASVIGTTVCASKEFGEPSHAGDAGGRSVWYRWTAPSNIAVTVTTIGSDFDTLLAVYTGTSVSSLNLIASNDDIVLYEFKQSRLTFNAISGVTYRIAVDGWQGENGRVILNLNPPPNDHFTNCIALNDPFGAMWSYNVGATKEPNELAHAGNIGGRSVWYCWTAPTNGRVRYDTIGSAFDTLLAVYMGNRVDALTLVGSDDGSGPNDTSVVQFNAVAGQTYRIAVDGFSGANGAFALRWGSPTNRLSIQRLAGNSVRLTLTGTPGNYAIEVSSGFQTWGLFTNFTMTGAVHQVTDTVPTGPRSRYYRAALQP